ncbi:hypothetical protein RI367_006220 [Sorochytrium milnesiophthora]
MLHYKITLVRSTIGLPKATRLVAESLGLTKLHKTVCIPANERTAGAILKLKQLVTVSNVQLKESRPEELLRLDRLARKPNTGFVVLGSNQSSVNKRVLVMDVKFVGEAAQEIHFAILTAARALAPLAALAISWLLLLSARLLRVGRSNGLLSSLVTLDVDKLRVPLVSMVCLSAGTLTAASGYPHVHRVTLGMAITKEQYWILASCVGIDVIKYCLLLAFFGANQQSNRLARSKSGSIAAGSSLSRNELPLSVRHRLQENDHRRDREYESDGQPLVHSASVHMDNEHDGVDRDSEYTRRRTMPGAGDPRRYSATDMWSTTQNMLPADIRPALQMAATLAMCCILYQLCAQLTTPKDTPEVAGVVSGAWDYSILERGALPRGDPAARPPASAVQPVLSQVLGLATISAARYLVTLVLFFDSAAGPMLVLMGIHFGRLWALQLVPLALYGVLDRSAALRLGSVVAFLGMWWLLRHISASGATAAGSTPRSDNNSRSIWSRLTAGRGQMATALSLSAAVAILAVMWSTSLQHGQPANDKARPLAFSAAHAADRPALLRQRLSRSLPDPRFDTSDVYRDGDKSAATWYTSPFKEQQPELYRKYQREHKLSAIVFYGRKASMRILHSYLERNLESNGGLLSEVIFVVNTDNHDDLRFLELLLTLQPAFYRKLVVKPVDNMDFSVHYDWMERDKLYVKIDDDVVFVEDGTIEALLQEKLRDRYLFVSANIVNHPLLSMFHQTLVPFVEYEPYRTDPRSMEDNTIVLRPWRRRPSGAPPPTDFHPPFWDSDCTWGSWRCAAIVHRNLFDRVRSNTMSLFGYDVHDFHTPDMNARWSINFFILNSTDILGKITEADDERIIAVELSKQTGKHSASVGTNAAAAHYAYNSQRVNLDKYTNIIDEYMELARATCGYVLNGDERVIA